MILLIGVARACQLYAEKHNIQPKDYKIVTSREGLLGYRDVEVLCVGNYYELENLRQVAREAEKLGFATKNVPL